MLKGNKALKHIIWSVVTLFWDCIECWTPFWSLLGSSIVSCVFTNRFNIRLSLDRLLVLSFKNLMNCPFFLPKFGSGVSSIWFHPAGRLDQFVRKPYWKIEERKEILYFLIAKEQTIRQITLLSGFSLHRGFLHSQRTKLNSQMISGIEWILSLYILLFI